MVSLNSIYRNHLEIFDPDQYDHYPITIIGCGSVGSFTAMTLAKMGFKTMFLYDSDIVEKHNIPVQFFNFDDIDGKKSNITADKIHYCSECTAIPFDIKYKKEYKLLSPIVIVSTDDMESRKKVFEACREQGIKLLIDARMGGEVFSIFTVNMRNKKDVDKYAKTFHESTRTSCTQKGIIYNVLMISSCIASQLVKVLQAQKYSLEINGCTKTLEIHHN